MLPMMGFTLLVNILISVTFSQCIENVTAIIEEARFTTHRQKVSVKPYVKGFHYSYFKNTLLGTSHFQGIYLNSKRTQMLITGADRKSKRADIFQFTKVNNRWKIHRYQNYFQEPYWHIGGLGGNDEFVAVPFESLQMDRSKKAVIRFIKLEDFNYRFLDYELETLHHHGAATDLIELDDGSLLLVLFNHFQVAIYRNASGDIQGGFELIKLIKKESMQAASGKNLKLKGQSIQFVKQCDGQIYLLEFDQEGNNLTYYLFRKSMIHLYRLNYQNKKAEIEWVSSRQFSCDLYCNLDAGTDVNIINNRLEFNSVYHYTTSFSKKIKFRTFIFRNNSQH